MADIKSKPNTAAYAAEYERVFGKDRPTPGRFLYRPGHPKANERGFVRADEVHDVDPGIGLQISVDRNYENLRTTDGVIIQSRRQHREYMKEHGVTVADDFKEEWKRKEKERERFFREGNNTEQDRKERREQVARAFYQRHKP